MWRDQLGTCYSCPFDSAGTRVVTVEMGRSGQIWELFMRPIDRTWQWTEMVGVKKKEMLRMTLRFLKEDRFEREDKRNPTFWSVELEESVMWSLFATWPSAPALSICLQVSKFLWSLLLSSLYRSCSFCLMHYFHYSPHPIPTFQEEGVARRMSLRCECTGCVCVCEYRITKWVQ